MKTVAVTLVLCVFISTVCGAQMEIQAQEKPRREVSSPLVAIDPLDKFLPLNERSFAPWRYRTEELSNTVCDAVIVKSIDANVTINSERTKAKLMVMVTTYTEPPKDKTAIVKFSLRNDDEVLLLSSSKYPNMNALTIKVNAEEKKTRDKTKTATVDPEQFFRIFEGKNPRVEIRLEVEDN